MLTLESKNNDKSHNDYKDDDFGLCKFWENINGKVKVYVIEELTYSESKQRGKDMIAFMFFKYGETINHGKSREMIIEPGSTCKILFRKYP